MAPQSVSKSTVHNTMSLQMKMIFFYTSFFFQIKLKKYKTSENEQSHGSFFLRIGGLGEKNVTKYFLAVQDNSISDNDGRSAGPRIIRALKALKGDSTKSIHQRR